MYNVHSDFEACFQKKSVSMSFLMSVIIIYLQYAIIVAFQVREPGMHINMINHSMDVYN